MGKSKNRRAAKVDDSDDDTFSTTSSTGASASSDWTASQEPVKERDEETILEDYIDALYEKRSSTREAGIKGLINALSAKVLTDFVENKYETLTQQFLASIKRGSSSEAALACHALGIETVTAGAGKISEQILEESFPHLVKLSKVGSSPAARISAIETLAIVTFVGAVDINATDQAMETFWQICSHKGNAHSDQTLGTTKPTPPVKEAAISAWSLLLSTLSADQIAARQLSSTCLPVLSSLLEVQDVGLRKATGEAIALLHEASEYVDDAKGAQVVEQMKSLAVDSTRKGQTKKERSEQRSSFREMLAAIEGGVCRETSLKLQYGDVLKVNTWTQTVQLNAFRRFLAEGFQKHMQENNLLHEIFDFVPRTGKQENLSAKQKRLFLSPNSVASKARTQLMNRKRSMAEAGRNYINGEYE